MTITFISRVRYRAPKPPAYTLIATVAALAPLLLIGCDRSDLTHDSAPSETMKEGVAGANVAPALAPTEPIGKAVLGEPAPVTLVENQEARAAIVLPEDTDEAAQQIARYFSSIIKRSTGVEIPIVQSEDGLSDETTRVHFGGKLAASLGLVASELPEEGYRILTQRNRLFIIGRDAAKEEGVPSIISRPTRWAVNRLLEEQLGVRWLWPGELGTYVPKSDSFALPATDQIYQPKLLQRRLRISMHPQRPLSMEGAPSELELRLKQEASEWAENHQSGQRGLIAFGHAFGGWWQKYSQQHPDFFALPPPGVTQPHFNRPDWVKFRLSNPAVIEQIAVEYKEAGAPEFYNVCPNDGAGFDLHPDTLAWDIPKNQNKDDIWRARGNLTARYVKFWNLLYDRLKEINPEVKLTTYAYHSYKTPPPKERPLTAKAVLGIVCGYHDYALWKGWSSQPGTENIFLRPNWGHIGANSPYIPLTHMARFMKFAAENGMIGFDLDSILGFWSTQGTNYYLWARLMTRPDLDRDAIVEEYSSAFGRGAGKIKEYLAYWEGVSDEISFKEDYANADPSAEKGKFVQLLREGKTTTSFVLGPRFAMPYLYPEKVVKPAYALLEEAERAIGDTDEEAAKRVQFLRDGLRELEATRDLIAVSRSITPDASPNSKRVKELYEKDSMLTKLREEVTARHVIWGGPVTDYENGRDVPMRPKTLKLPELNTDGQ